MNRRSRSRRLARRCGLDLDAIRRGLYSDIYFLNASRALARTTAAGATYDGPAPALRGPHPRLRGFRPGDAEVEMQFFSRRSPRTLVAGIPLALAILEACHHGSGAAGAARPAGSRLGVGGRARPPRVLAVREGTLVRPLDPVLVVRGRYRDFAHLETILLGVLTRASRIASNVHEALVAARGKPVLFFPARFDLPSTQPVDGYAYRLAVSEWSRRRARRVVPLVSTAAQGWLWGGRGTGTVPHAFILCYLGDTAAAMLDFCRAFPPGSPRVALVDTTNDCVGESVRTARRLFDEYLRHLRAGRRDEARRYVLHGVRADTAQDLRDRSVPRSAGPRMERGVTPVLVRLMRRALDAAPSEMTLPPALRHEAERYFRSVRIIATGGFDVEKIRFFERHRAPVDAYGVGSSFLRGPSTDFTADVVRVKVGGRFMVAAKVGRGPRPRRLLRPVRL